ncbi:MAG TPA: ATPase, T2SS/T4P/T4SS family [Acidobacteriota bacterium]|nr:ATPase, T2SS/T4P/T4SS family [Acidobacteriota bacterium]
MNAGQQLNLDLLKYLLGPIAPHLSDPACTDIFVYGYRDVFVKRQGRRLERVAAAWRSDTDLMLAAESIAEHIHRRLDADHPILDSRLPDGSRVNIVIPPCYPAGACVSIRIFPQERYGAADLLGFGTLDSAGIDILRAAVAAGANILISGGTGSGKTTLLNVLASFIPGDDIVVTVEDSREISLSRPLWAPLESKHALHADDRPVTLQDLVRNSLRMNPRWLLVGEVRGAEALDLLRAFNTGHAGMSTVHANSAVDALGALESLVLQSGLDIPARAVKELVSRAIRVVAHIHHFPDDSRKVAEIVEVRGLEYETSPSFPPYRVVPLYRYGFAGTDPAGTALGRFAVEQPPSFLDELRLRNIPLPEVWR